MPVCAGRTHVDGSGQHGAGRAAAGQPHLQGLTGQDIPRGRPRTAIDADLVLS